MLPLYLGVAEATPTRPAGGHRGLWYDRFYRGFTLSKDTGPGTKDAKTDANDEKRRWIDGVTGRCGDAEALKRHALQRLALADALGATSQVFTTDWHFVTGLGLPHPVENGFAWHPTLGVPYLTGAAVKGLTRAWIHSWADDIPDDERERIEIQWFGDQDGEVAGSYCFFDAIPVSPPELGPDVMTPHLGKWYELGGGAYDPERSPDRVPADWHDPVPVPFLVVKRASFLFTVAQRRVGTPGGSLPAVMRALTQALDFLGAGAKTAVGYGRMAENAVELDKLRAEVEQERRRVADEVALAALDPLERSMKEVVDAGGQDPAHVSLLRALKQGKWHGSDVRIVAEHVRKWMVENNRWREQPAKKDKDHQRTKDVLGYLSGE